MMMPPGARRLSRSADIMATCLVVLALAVVIYGLHAGRPILAPTAVAGLLALTLSPVHGWMERRGVAAALGSALIVLGLITVIAAVVYLLLPSYEALRYRLPEVVERLGETVTKVGETVQEAVEEVKDAARSPEEHAQIAQYGDGTPAGDGGSAEEMIADGFSTPLAAVSGRMAGLLVGAPSLAATLLYMVLLTFFLLSERRRVFRTFTALVASTQSGRRHVARSMRALHRDVAYYFLVVTLINIGLGVATALVFTALGMPNAALWGALMALLNYIPYLGPAIMNAMVFTIALLVHGSIELGLLCVGGLLMLNLLEGQLVTPMLIGRRFMLGSLPVFLGVAFGAWLWGAVGALLSTPVLIVARAAYLYFTADESDGDEAG